MCMCMCMCMYVCMYVCTHCSRDGGDVVMAEGEHYDIPGLGQLIRNTRQLIMTQIQRHQVTNSENIRWNPRILNVVVISIQYLHHTVYISKDGPHSLYISKDGPHSLYISKDGSTLTVHQ